MSRGHKRLLAAGLLVVAIGAGGLVVRHRRAEQAAMRLRAADGPTQRGFEASETGAPAGFAARAPETPDEIAAQVAGSLQAWRQAIAVKDAETVLSLDRSFLTSPDRYRAALAESARKDADERVRAFSTRVLGKQKDASLAELFETLLADKSPFVRQNAAWALGELAAREDGRAAAQRAVAELRHTGAKDPAPDVRSAAKGALARLE
jgi:HEAT repeat protein